MKFCNHEEYNELYATIFLIEYQGNQRSKFHIFHCF